MWTVYDHPKDFPHSFVARRFEVAKAVSWPTDDILVSGDLDMLRDELAARGLTPITRDPDDDPKIVEVWL
jgi:hypothetical protein